VPTAPPEPLFGIDLPGFDYSIGGTEFAFDFDTAVDRLLGRNGANLGDAVGAAGDIAGAGAGAAASGVMASLEPWVGRVAMIILALVFIGGGIALLSSGKPVQIVKEALA